MENRHTKEDLAIMQALPLDLKVRLTEDRIRAWVDKYGEDGVCVSFSGGKDSTAPEYDGEWKNWNFKQIWTPNEKGLGMKKVFDMCNEIMGKDFYRYE